MCLSCLIVLGKFDIYRFVCSYFSALHIQSFFFISNIRKIISFPPIAYVFIYYFLPIQKKRASSDIKMSKVKVILLQGGKTFYAVS